MAQNILLVKLSSLGDVVHSFAAVSDIVMRRDVQVTWAVEEDFVDLVRLHPAVSETIAVPLRRLRTSQRFWWRTQSWQDLITILRQRKFDTVIDGQGLIKSALLAYLSRCSRRVGFDRHSAREGVASWGYTQRIAVAKNQHAIARTRALCAKALAYHLPKNIDFGLPLWQAGQQQRLLFLHGTTWQSKCLPESTWQGLIHLAEQGGYEVDLLWSNEEERARAKRLASQSHASVLSGMGIVEIYQRFVNYAGVISVDTGLGQLAGACGLPTLGVFAPTSAVLTGITGKRAQCLSQPNPCMQKDCRRHGGLHPNACMNKYDALEIWQHFLTVVKQ